MERAEFDKWKPKEVARLLALVETERRYYQEIVASLPISLLIVGPDLKLVSTNRSFRQRIRRRNEDLLGRSLAEVLPIDGAEAIARAILDGSPTSPRQSLLWDGQPVSLTALPLRSWEEDSDAEVLLVIENESGARLTPEQERSLSAVSALDGVLWEQDPQTGQLTFASAAAAEILGFTPTQLLEDASLWPLRVAEPDRGRVEALYARLSDSSSDHFAVEYRGRDAEGGEQWLRESVRVRRNAEGKPLWLTGVITRIGARREIEQARAVAAKSEALQRLSARLAHDLNNLLMIVGGYGEELKNALPAGHLLEQDMAEILSATARLSSLTTELQTYTRRPALEAQPLVFASLIESLRPRLTAALGPAIELHIEEHTGLHSLAADPSVAADSLLALARTAAALLQGQGRLLIRAANSRREESSGRDCVQITCALDGAEWPSWWLEPWLAPDDAQRDLALALSASYHALHVGEGDLRFDGHTAILDFPAATAAATPAPLPVATPALAEPAPTLETVLVVEDEGGIRALVRKILRRQGYEVFEAPGGAEALEVLREHGPRINLLLTDVMMPGMNGVELSREATSLYPNLRVLFVSGYTDESVLEAGRFPSGTAFLQKPFTLGSLLGKVREVLDSESQSSPAHHAAS